MNEYFKKIIEKIKYLIEYAFIDDDDYDLLEGTFIGELSEKFVINNLNSLINTSNEQMVFYNKFLSNIHYLDRNYIRKITGMRESFKSLFKNNQKVTTGSIEDLNGYMYQFIKDVESYNRFKLLLDSMDIYDVFSDKLHFNNFHENDISRIKPVLESTLLYTFKDHIDIYVENDIVLKTPTTETIKDIFKNFGTKLSYTLSEAEYLKANDDYTSMIYRRAELILSYFDDLIKDVCNDIGIERDDISYRKMYSDILYQYITNAHPFYLGDDDIRFFREGNPVFPMCLVNEMEPYQVYDIGINPNYLLPKITKGFVFSDDIVVKRKDAEKLFSWITGNFFTDSSSADCLFATATLIYVCSNVSKELYKLLFRKD